MSNDEHSSSDQPVSPSDESPPEMPPAHDVRTYVEDGVRLAGILGVWGVIAAASAAGLGNVGSTSGLFSELGPALGGLFLLAGLFNAVLFVVYRGIDYSRV